MQAAAVGEAGRVGGNGREQRLREPAREERLDAVALDVVGERSSASTRAARSARVGDARAIALTSTRPRTRSGRSSASRRHSRPPIEYPT